MVTMELKQEKDMNKHQLDIAVEALATAHDSSTNSAQREYYRAAYLRLKEYIMKNGELPCGNEELPYGIEIKIVEACDMLDNNVPRHISFRTKDESLELTMGEDYPLISKQCNIYNTEYRVKGFEEEGVYFAELTDSIEKFETLARRLHERENQSWFGRNFGRIDT